jgi:hypothetical protein
VRRLAPSVLIAVAAASGLPSGASAAPPDQITPVVASVLAAPEPVVATDGRKHLVALPAHTRPAAERFTPLVMSVLAPPRWFKGVDRRFHLVYELTLTNGFPVPVSVRSETRAARQGLTSISR